MTLLINIFSRLLGIVWLSLSILAWIVAIPYLTIFFINLELKGFSGSRLLNEIEGEILWIYFITFETGIIMIKKGLL